MNEVKENLYEFYTDCGRMGHLEGVFIATAEEVNRAIGKYMDFGEALGKHSQVDGVLEQHEIVLKSDDQAVINLLIRIFGRTVSGYNPLDYIDPSQYDDEEEFEDEEDLDLED